MQTDLLHDRAEKALKHFRSSKVRYVVANNGPIDLEPTLAISADPVDPDGEPHGYLASLANTCVVHEHPVTERLATLLASFRQQFGRPAWVLVCSEAHQRIDDDPTPVKPGELRQDFAENPMSKVQETLVVFFAHDDMVGGCDLVVHSQPFHYADGGLIEWGDVLKAEDLNDDDAIIAVIKAGFEPVS